MKKIMFNTKYGLEQAVLNGSKTMTRRIVPQHILQKVEEFQDEYYNGALATISDKDAILSLCTYEYHHRFPQVGEIIAIAQNYETMANGGYIDKMLDSQSRFKQEYCGAGYKNKMFVKADLMPHHIRITNIRVEHLQDIDDCDCLREGIKEQDCHIEEYKKGFYQYSPRKAFAKLIDKVAGKGTWDSNPWVLVYEFELID